MCSDCEAYRLKEHGLTRSDYIWKPSFLSGVGLHEGGWEAGMWIVM